MIKDMAVLTAIGSLFALLCVIAVCLPLILWSIGLRAWLGRVRERLHAWRVMWREM